MVLDISNKFFAIYIATLVKPIIMSIYFFYKTKVALLINIKISAKYSDFLNVLFLDFAIKLLEYVKINDNFINLLNSKKTLYGLIYNLRVVELKILKTYIKANLVSNLIRSSKSLASTLILFIQKKDNTFYLCIDY